MKGIGFGASGFNKKKFHAENSKVFAERHPFRGHSVSGKRGFNVENMPVIECIHFGAMVQKSGVFGHEGHPVGGTMIQPKRASMLRHVETMSAIKGIPHPFLGR